MISYIKSLFRRKPQKLEAFHPVELKVYKYIGQATASIFTKFVERALENPETAFYQQVQKTGLKEPMLAAFELTYDSVIKELGNELESAKSKKETAK